MKTYKLFFLVIWAVAMISCGSKQSKSTQKDEQALPQEETVVPDKSFKKACRETKTQIDVLQRKLEDPQQYATQQGVEELQRLSDELSFNYNAEELDSAELVKAQKMDSMILLARQSVAYAIQQNVCNTPHPLLLKPEELLSEAQEYPLYLERGDKLLIQVSAEKNIDIRVYNTNSHQLLKNYTGKKNVKDSIVIQFAAIYLVEINPKGRQYANINISYKPNSINRAFATKTIETREVEGQKGDFRVKAIPGIKMQNLFEEPRKFTLRSQLKAAFSGTTNSDRAIVAIQIPAGAKDVLYSLRISTNEGGKSSDGKFSDNLAKSYKKVKFLGIPLYERTSTHGSSLMDLLLGENQPPREEEAYINMYVFYNATQAKKFQDGGDVTKLQYSIDHSRMGSQSCNGRIPTKGQKTIYIGFQNERVRYNNYVWLEAVSAVPNTEYLKKEYIVK